MIIKDYDKLSNEDIKDRFSDMDWYELLGELDDTIQFDLVKCDNARWRKMIDEKRVYMLLTEEIKKRLQQLEDLTEG